MATKLYSLIVLNCAFSLKQRYIWLIVSFQRIQVNFFLSKKHDNNKSHLNDKNVEKSYKDVKKISRRASTTSRDRSGIVKLNMNHWTLEGPFGALHPERVSKVRHCLQRDVTTGGQLRRPPPVSLGTPGKGPDPCSGCQIVMNT